MTHLTLMLSYFMDIGVLLIVYCLFGVYVTFNTVQVISRRVVGRAEETSTYSSLGFCTVNCRPTATTTSFPTDGHDGDRTPTAEVGGESVTIWYPEYDPDLSKNVIISFF